MDDDQYDAPISPSQRGGDDWASRMGVVTITLVLIVVSIIVLNRIFVPDTGTENPDIEIPDYPVGEYVEYVSDGDTIKTVEGDWIRLLGINTEEKGMPHADAATHKITELLTHGPIKLERDLEDTDHYDRLLRYVWAGDTFINLELVRLGYAHVFVIEPNVKYWDELKAAEEEAIANNRVLWQPSAFDVEITLLEPVQGSGAAGLNVERVTFKNNGTASIDMTNWTVKDEATHIYHFDSLTLAPNATVTLHSGQGSDTDTNVYWQRTSSVWNNAGDVCFLRDENGLLVDGWRYWQEDSGYVWIYY